MAYVILRKPVPLKSLPWASEIILGERDELRAIICSCFPVIGVMIYNNLGAFYPYQIE
jgi:hypothetical protein